jgi:NADH:ubiquinone oxidoreductase subunit 4 (subunit M)
MIRLYQRSMHNRLAPGAESRELTIQDGLVIAPVVAVIIALALYPQFVLHRAEPAVKASTATQVTIFGKR